VPDGHRLAAGQRGQLGGKLGSGRHDGSVDQHRDDRHIAVQSGDRFGHHPVAGIIEAPLTLVIGDQQPLGPDHRQEDVAVLNRLPDHVGEVRTRLDRVHVHEDLEPLDQPVGQTASNVAGILTPVADKHPGRSAHTHLQTMITRCGHCSIGRGADSRLVRISAGYGARRF
jgi:hypothetical protein